MSTSPYENLPSSKFWRTGVVEENPESLTEIYEKKFSINASEKIAAAGSCFAQHISVNLKNNGFNVLDLELPPEDLPKELYKRNGYSMYSARYGNIYTSRQLLQLLKSSFNNWEPGDWIWEKNGRFYDALRPAVMPDGLDSAEQVMICREDHLEKVRQLFEDLDVFIYTLGLTETWMHKESGTVYPTAPGTIAGQYDSHKYVFYNMAYTDVLDDLHQFIENLIKYRNGRNFKMIVTVSPVPLTATASENHVLVSTVYSKAILRSVAGSLYRKFDFVDYFPSYEIVTNPKLCSSAFESNYRSVKTEAVKNVMKHFFREHKANSLPEKSIPDKNINSEAEDDTPCEDALLEQFSALETSVSYVDSGVEWAKSFETVEEFLKFTDIKKGVYVIKSACKNEINGDIYPLVFEISSLNPGKPIVCALHGAVDKKKSNLPVLQARNYYKNSLNNATCITFCDPLIYSKMTNAGWYTFNNKDPIILISKTISHINAFIANANKYIFVGGSTAGFACLRLSRYFKDANMFIWNPQTNINKYNHVTQGEYLSLLYPTQVEIKGGALFSEMGIEYNLCETDYLKEFNGKIFFLQQIGDWHVKAHMIPFFSKIFDESVNKWTDIAEKGYSGWVNRGLFLHLGNWRTSLEQGSHIAPTVQLIHSAITELIDKGNLDDLNLEQFNTNIAKQ